MKKYIFSLLATLLMVVGVKAYTINPGDTLSGISQKHNTTVEALALYNNIENPDLIYAGDTLDIVSPQDLGYYFESQFLGDGLIGGNPIPTDNYDTYLTASADSDDTSFFVNELPTDISEAIYTLFEDDGRTVAEKIYCTGTSSSPNKLTGCIRGLSASPGNGNTISETAGTGTSHSKNARIAITDNINYTGKALAILSGYQKTSSTEFIFGDAATNTTKYFYFCDSTSTSTCGFIYATASSTDTTKQVLGYSPDGTTTYTFDEGSSGLGAGKGTTISNSEVNWDPAPTSTSGLGFTSSQATVVVGDGLTINGDGIVFATTTDITVTGNWTFNGTGTHAFAGDVSVTGTTTLSSTTTAPFLRGSVTTQMTAAEAITRGDAVVIGENGIYRADASLASTTVHFVGFAKDSVSAGESVDVFTSGVVSGFSGLTTASTTREQYLSDTTGALSSSSGTVERSVGRAISATELLIQEPSSMQYLESTTNLPAVVNQYSKVLVVEGKCDNGARETEGTVVLTRDNASATHSTDNGASTVGFAISWNTTTNAVTWSDVGSCTTDTWTIYQYY